MRQWCVREHILRAWLREWFYNKVAESRCCVRGCKQGDCSIAGKYDRSIIPARNRYCSRSVGKPGKSLFIVIINFAWHKYQPVCSRRIRDIRQNTYKQSDCGCKCFYIRQQPGRLDHQHKQVFCKRAQHRFFHLGKMFAYRLRPGNIRRVSWKTESEHTPRRPMGPAAMLC